MSHEHDPWSEHQSPHLESDPKADPRDRLRENWTPSTFNSLSDQRSLSCSRLQGAYGLVGADTHDRNNYNEVSAYRVPQRKWTKHNTDQDFPTAFGFCFMEAVFSQITVYIVLCLFDQFTCYISIGVSSSHHLIFLFCAAEFFSCWSSVLCSYLRKMNCFQQVSSDTESVRALDDWMDGWLCGWMYTG